MNRTLFILITILIMLISATIIMVNHNVNVEKEVAKFNLYYENFLDKTFYGTEVATLIGKAIDNNEKYNIPKNQNGLYILDNQYSIKIYINLMGSSKTYDMEKINNLGISQFIANFNTLTFTCKQINYHDTTKRVSEMYIQEVTE